MRQFTTRDLSKDIGDVTAAVGREPVVLTRHGKPRFVLMSYEHYEKMRAGGDPRRGHRASEMPEENKQLFAAAIDRLANGEGYDADP
ncbi:type II toxin-antitoxin system Phd/YefM family antitoxin [Ciceribacter ferrooxidans]|uniref:Antitoxin n=1 Tax=Ciceribacter ferrooxidans TaxID=2509717 RepID=A0A4Q2TW71_9HYPH|nr:type II toxin-antitoxin system prevent-host-death family antitoxin [Ciceribacter ferrooxidans]RYC23201.1 type II toxin-antitoxin system Phd/YefM family antitoxin [Ciceribacter ferrooxidans]